MHQMGFTSNSKITYFSIKGMWLLSFFSILRSPVEVRSRSRVTIPFRLCKDDKPDEALEKAFLSEAEKKYSLKELKGHRSVGGIRAAIFNAISYEEVEKLAAFMKEFQNNNK
jgi:phosphoserine aminotransferase